jgi:hypothetical protein
MIVQFLGIDVENRNKIAKQFASDTSSFYCTDRELPMASLEAQFARWLRTIAGIVERNNIKNTVLSGFFPTKESRQQFKEGMNLSNIITVWVDTILPENAKEPTGHHATTDYRWEMPNETEYDLRITNNEDSLNTVLKTLKEKMG